MISIWYDKILKTLSYAPVMLGKKSAIQLIYFILRVIERLLTPVPPVCSQMGAIVAAQAGLQAYSGANCHQLLPSNPPVISHPMTKPGKCRKRWTIASK
jgi:hypothetical protein